MSVAVGVVADDMTGAHDTAVQFACRGWPTLLDLRDATAGRAAAADPGTARDVAVGHGRVVAVTSDSRALGEGAAAATQAAVEGLAGHGVERLYLKIDSSMRGSVHWQVLGALTAWSRRHPGAVAVVCPSYPAMGRTVVDGSVMALGVPLHLGPAGHDPVTPVATSRMSELLPGSAHVSAPVDRDAVRLAAELARHSGSSSVLTVDARTDQDLELLAAALVRLGPGVVPVGSAGLAAALAHRWVRRPGAAAAGAGCAGQDRSVASRTPSVPARGPVIVLVTSLHEVSVQQVRHLRAHRDPSSWHLSPALADLVDEASLTAWCHDQGRPATSPEVVLVTAPTPDGGSTAPPVAGMVARGLARIAEHARRSVGAAAVVVVGGDGARALLSLWGGEGIAVRGAVVEGVPYGLVVGGTTDGLPIVTKSGGFGRADAVTVAVEHALGVAGDQAGGTTAHGAAHRGAPRAAATEDRTTSEREVSG